MKTVLVIRPSPDGEKLCEALQQVGLNTVFFPTIKLEALDPPSVQLANFDYSIFISPAAVRFFGRAFGSSAWPANNHVAVMGDATAEACRFAGIPVVFQPATDYSSAGLLALLAHKNLQNRSVLLIKGAGGLETIACELRTRGALVTELPVYRRSPSIQTDFKVEWPSIDVIIATSLEALHNLKHLLPASQLDQVLKIPVLVSSERLRKGATELGFTGPFITSQNATIKAILSALLTH